MCSFIQAATNILLAYLRGTEPSKNIDRINGSLELPTAALALNFIRGGRSGYLGTAPSGTKPDGTKITKAQWDASNLLYRQAIATIVDQMAKDYSLMGDNRRVNVDVKWQ